MTGFVFFGGDLLMSGMLALFFLGLFGTAELLYHRFRVQAEHTRKLVHVGTGLLTLLFPVLLSDQIWVFALCASFLLILLASRFWRLLPSINGVERKTYGSLLYPVIVYLVFLFFAQVSLAAGQKLYLYFYLPILILAIGDPVAALVGRRFPLRSFRIWGGNKSLGGSSAFLAVAFGLSLLLMFWNAVPFSFGDLASGPGGVFGICLEIAVLATLAEALSGNGWDNFTVPGAVVLVLFVNLPGVGG